MVMVMVVGGVMCLCVCKGGLTALLLHYLTSSFLRVRSAAGGRERNLSVGLSCHSDPK